MLCLWENIRRARVRVIAGRVAKSVRTKLCSVLGSLVVTRMRKLLVFEMRKYRSIVGRVETIWSRLWMVVVLRSCRCNVMTVRIGKLSLAGDSLVANEWTMLC